MSDGSSSLQRREDASDAESAQLASASARADFLRQLRA